MTKTMLIAASVSVALAGIQLHAQVTGTVDSHLAAAKAAAGTMHTCLLYNLTLPTKRIV
jgi:hypothetical protein